MKETKYIECQCCKKVFKVRKSSREEITLLCVFCNSDNLATIDKKYYDRYYKNSLIKR